MARDMEKPCEPYAHWLKAALWAMTLIGSRMMRSVADTSFRIRKLGGGIRPKGQFACNGLSMRGSSLSAAWLRPSTGVEP